MLKKIVLFALVLFTTGAFAQEKIAHINAGEVITAMPEYTQMQDSLQKTQSAIEAELKGMEEEYNKKYTALMEEGDKLIESIKIRRMQEIKDIEERAQNYQRESQSQLQQLQQLLFAPVQQKFKSAVEAIGEENGFTYIMDVSTILYVNPKSVDATPLVKKKLGLK
ncbi:MAG: OmpH family outer membrane protein [Dysgonamonadaceae bacterium]|jgi:outer membrane protein|nr:OmpH family outer membrane protein [Dysgonamonadaceae bacterium]